MDIGLFNKRCWELYKQICDKQDLDIRGDQLSLYRMNYRSAYEKAFNIVLDYMSMEEMSNEQIMQDNDTLTRQSDDD